MKKCASCSKDLPEAALHCVFCGAKQAPTPAVQPGLAKTAFGYSANEVMQQLGNPQPAQPAQPAYQPPRPQSGSQPPPMGYAPPATANATTMKVSQGGAPVAQNPGYPAPAAPPYNPPAHGYAGPQGYAGAQQQGYAGGQQQGYAGGQQQGYAGAQQQGYAGAQQQGYAGAQQQGYAGAQQQGYAGAQQQGGMGIHSPPQPTPEPLPPVQTPPYLGARSARAGRPTEPWKHSLRFMMVVWGAAALAAFATPLALDPLTFNWDAILDGAGTAMIPPLIWAATALLSLVVAALPMITLGRGIIAAVLGLSGVLVPLVLAGMPPWQTLLPLVGMLALVPGLFVRNEYTDSLVARILVTIGVVCTLLPLVIPTGGEIPLVGLFKGLIEAPGEGKVDFIVDIALLVVVVMSLLVWMPGPATAGGKVFGWVLVLFPVVDFAVSAALAGGIGDRISQTPGALVVWVPGVTYSVLIGYGVATVVGKQLE